MFSAEKKLIYGLALAFLLSVFCFSGESDAATLVSALTVTTEIDNADEIPGVIGDSFRYEVRAFYGYTRSTNYIYVPDVKASEQFTIRNGETKRLFPGGIYESGQTGSWYYGAQRTQTPRDWCFYFMPVASGTMTDNRISFTGIEYRMDTTRYTYNNNGSRCSEPIECFNYVRATGQNPEVVLHFRYNGEVKDTKTVFDPKLTYSKKIDYLGNGGNPETGRNGANDYRLYLDAFTDYQVAPEYKRKNIVFVLDCSGSMAYNMDGTKTSNVRSSEQRITKLKEQASSMINTLKADPENRYSVIKFAGSGGAECVIKENKVTADRAVSAITSLTANGGTNYYSGLSLITQCLVQSEDCENIVIFITDGQPTAIPDSITGASSGTDNEYPVALPYAVYEAGSLPGDQIEAFYSILINTNKGYGSALQTVSQAVGTQGNKASVMVSSEAELKNVLDTIAIKLVKKASELRIRDDLSENVEYLGTPVVKAKPEDGEERVLSEGTEVELVISERSICADIKNIEPRTKYSLSFDIGASETAVRKFSSGAGYSDRGDQGTDYDPDKGIRSSGKPGYYSNDEAEVTLFWTDGSTTYIYGKPVIQVVKPDGIQTEIAAQKEMRNTETGKEETPLREGEFRFRLYDKDGGVKKEIGITENDAEGTVRFSAVPVPDINDHDYYIEEIPGSDEHISYDTHTARATVHSGYSAESGKLFIRSIDFDPNAPGVFRNGFRFGHAFETLTAEKLLIDYNRDPDAGGETGRSLADGQFQFVLRNREKALLRNYRANNRADGTVTYPALELIEPGTYVVYLSENRAYAHDPSIIYDRSEKKAVIEVTADENRDLHAKTRYDDGNRFTNAVWKKDTAEVTLDNIILLYGMEWNEELAGKFEFELCIRKQGEQSGDWETVVKARNDAAGRVVLEPEFTRFFAYDNIPEQDPPGAEEEAPVIDDDTPAEESAVPEDRYDCIIRQVVPGEGRIPHMVYDTDTVIEAEITVRQSEDDPESLEAGIRLSDESIKFVNSYSVKTLMK